MDQHDGLGDEMRCHIGISQEDVGENFKLQNYLINAMVIGGDGGIRTLDTHF
jgi:hypothetical protein